MTPAILRNQEGLSQNEHSDNGHTHTRTIISSELLFGNSFNEALAISNDNLHGTDFEPAGQINELDVRPFQKRQRTYMGSPLEQRLVHQKDQQGASNSLFGCSQPR